MAVEVNHIKGQSKGKIMLYALSTCIWCRKTKKLLDDLNVEYDFVDVDLQGYDEQQEIMKEIEKYNPGGGFPTMIIDGKDCIVGFDEEKIKNKFGNKS